MQSTSSGYTDAVTSPTQTPASVVLVDWNRDGWSVGDPIDDITRYVERVEVDSAITSDLPDSTRMVAGYAATEARIDLVSDPDDNTRSAAELWSPYATDSPYYGKTRIGAPFLAELQGLRRRNESVGLLARMTDADGFVDEDTVKRFVADAAAPLYYLAGPPAMVEAMKKLLRAAGVSIQMHASSGEGMGSMKSQFKKADASGARFALVFGADELAQDMVTVKSLRDGVGAQVRRPLAETAAWAAALQA